MNRISWIDMSKGFAIICVVLGHSGYSAIEIFVNSFHMSLFFILAGYTFDAKKDAISFVKQKSIRLLLPYFFTLFVDVSHDLIVSYIFNHDNKSLFSITTYRCKQYVLGLGTSGARTSWTNIEPVGVLWFIPCLFLAIILFYCLINLVHDNMTILFTICIALSLIGYFISIYLFLPWSFDISLFSMIFMFAGYYFKHTNFIEHIPKMHYVLLIIIWFVGLNSYPITMNERNYHTYFIPVITAISATIIIFKFLRLLDSIPLVQIPLSYLGKYSIIIMIFHTYIKSSWIKGIPWGLPFCILLSIVRIIICVCLVEIIRRIPILNKIYGIVTY